MNVLLLLALLSLVYGMLNTHENHACANSAIETINGDDMDASKCLLNCEKHKSCFYLVVETSFIWSGQQFFTCMLYEECVMKSGIEGSTLYTYRKHIFTLEKMSKICKPCHQSKYMWGSKLHFLKFLGSQNNKSCYFRPLVQEP